MPVNRRHDLQELKAVLIEFFSLGAWQGEGRKGRCAMGVALHLHGPAALDVRLTCGALLSIASPAWLYASSGASVAVSLL